MGWKPYFNTLLILLVICSTPVGAAATEARKALKVRQIAPIEFGVFTSSTSGGSITIDARSGSRTTSGDIAVLGGNYGQAEFEITGHPAEEILVYFPSEAPLDNKTGAGGMTMSKFIANPAGIIVLNEQGRATIHVGATLRVAPQTTRGSYNGYFNLDARYLR